MTNDVDTRHVRLIAEEGYCEALLNQCADTIDALRKRVAELGGKWVEGPPPDDRNWYWIWDDSQRLCVMTGQNAKMWDCLFHMPIVRPAPPEPTPPSGRAARSDDG